MPYLKRSSTRSPATPSVLDTVKVESTKQSLFVQVHVVADSILTLRIPLLYEVSVATRGEV